MTAEPEGPGPVFVVAGGLNIDLIGAGVPSLLGPGGQVLGGTLNVRPGGKARNVAHLLASYLGALPGVPRVAMIGRTARDPFGLWRLPLDALQHAGVETSGVTLLDEDAGQLPGVALIPVTPEGRHQIYVLPGANADFSSSDVDRATPLFDAASRQGGLLIVSLEIPRPTALHALAVARRCGLRVAIDPGGMPDDGEREEGFVRDVDILKPNAHEASMLTGIEVHDDSSAASAATALRARGARAVLITMGPHGGWWADADGGGHLPAPPTGPGPGDETGCGDQAMAVLCAEVYRGRAFVEACRLAMAAAALQFTKMGVTPLTAADVMCVVERGRAS